MSVKIIWVNRHTIVDNIYYAEHESEFGNILIASTEHGICSAEYTHKKLDKATWIKQLSKKWRKTQFIENKALTENYINSLTPNSETDTIVHIHGSDFQQGIWQALLDIPCGEKRTYKQIAQVIGNEKAHRAVGTAIASNPVAVLIPCHRVIKANGNFGGYRWGEDKKTKLLNWEFKNTPEQT